MKYYDNCDIEGYLVDENQGNGAFGSVFSIKNNVNVVVKTIELTDYVVPNNTEQDAQGLWDDIGLDKIINEIKILKTLKGTQIAPEYYESWICMKNDRLFAYIAEERMDRSYSDWMSDGNILYDKEYDILKNKLKKLHKLNIVHSDFHSGNIMLKIKESSGNRVVEPYINDFGISRFSKAIIQERKDSDLRAFERLYNIYEKYETEFIALLIIYSGFSILIN